MSVNSKFQIFGKIGRNVWEFNFCNPQHPFHAPIKNDLSKSKYFKNVVINSSSLDREGARVNFDLRIELL